MKILLDTNILIHREGNNVVKGDIGILFNWIDRLHYEKCIHPLSVNELEKHGDPKVVSTISAKIQSYNVLKTLSADTKEVVALRAKYDSTENDRIDTSILSELFSGKLDFLISEDRGIHRKAIELNISDRVFTIDGFLEKVQAENPEFVDYKVLSVRKRYFGHINIDDPFFDSFKRGYSNSAATRQ